MSGGSPAMKGNSRNATPDHWSPESTRRKNGALKSKIVNGSHSDIVQAPIQLQSNKRAEVNYKQIATEVANLINPTLERSIEKAVSTLRIDINKLTEQLTSQNNLLLEMEERVSLLEDNSSTINNKVWFLHKIVKELESKTEDLENRSRRNNLRFIGIPEQ